MSRWLSSDDIRRVTGRKKAKAQCRVLDQRGITYTRDADGWPVVLWCDYTHRTDHETPSQEPNFSFISKAR